MESKEVQRFIRDLGELPTLPVMAIRVMEMAVDDRTQLKDFVDVLRQDPSLAARVLKLANSPCFLGRQPVKDLQRAVQMLGMRAVRNLALSVLVFDLFDKQANPNGASTPAQPALDMAELWKHAVATALVAEDVARAIGYAQPEEAYIAGLLHDIGKVVLYHAAPSRLEEVLAELRTGTPSGMIDTEDRVLGYNHCQLGRWLASHWRLPSGIAQAIAMHHQPVTGSSEDELHALAGIVRCANEIVHAHRIGASGNDYLMPRLGVWEAAYGLQTKQMEQMAAKALEGMRDLLSVLGMTVDVADLYMSLVRRANAEVSRHALQLEGQHRTLEARQRILEAVSKFAVQPMADIDLETLLHDMLRATCQAMDLPGASCLVLSPASDQVTGLRYEREDDNSVPLNVPLSGAKLPEIKTLDGEGVTLSPMERLLLSDRGVFELAESLLRSAQGGTLLTIPLVAGGLRRGLLAIDTQALPEALTPELRSLADVFAVVLDRFLTIESLTTQSDTLARAARRVEETQLQLFHNERLASVGRLAAGAAHEIRNPLTAISGNAQLMLRIDDPERSRTWASSIIEQCKRIEKIINDLMGFARPAAPDLEACDAQEMVEHVLELVGHRVSTVDIDFKTSFDDDLPRVCADKRQIEQVLLNLVVNAVQAMPERGRLEVGAKPTGDRNMVEISIKDSGHGIAPEHLKQIFDPFFTTKSEHRGMGLGLAVSYSIVQNHGGSLTVESRVGKGTTFHLCLPVDQAEAVRAMQAGLRVISGSAKRKGSGHVLIVDDEKPLREMVAQFLEEEGYQTTQAEDGMQGLQKLTTGQFDLVVLDLRMPRKNGMEFLRGVADTMPKLPVLVVSGMATEEEIAEAKQLGAFGYLPKPFDLNDLLNMVERGVKERMRRMKAKEKPGTA